MIYKVTIGKKTHYVEARSPESAANIIFRTLDLRELYTLDGIVRSRADIRSVVVREA